MRRYHAAYGLTWLAGLISAWLLFLGTPAPVLAATMDEIISMHKAGLPAEVIIKVIDATGIEFTIDADALAKLKGQGLDDAVLNRLADFIPSEIKEETNGGSGGDKDVTRHPNWFGGEGFHSPETDRSTRRYRDSGDYYGPENSRYQTPYGSPPGSIWMSQPPVYVMGHGPSYPGCPFPRYYSYAPGYWNGNVYVFYGNSYFPYEGYNPCYSEWWRNQEYSSKWYLDWRLSGRRHEWDSSLDLKYRDDKFRIRIHF